jgi:hypothetical protein
MIKLGGNNVRHWSRRWEWIVGSLTIVSLVASSRLGHRLPVVVQDATFLFLVCLPLILVTMSWVGFKTVLRNETVARWRIWTCFCGCIALSLALLIPLLVVLLTLDYTRWVIWIIGAGMVSLLAGICGPRSVRFPLLFGGLIMSGLVVIIPVGIL